MKHVLVSLCIISACLLPASAQAQVHTFYDTAFYDLTGNNISSTFNRFIRCNAGTVPASACSTDFASPYFLYDNATEEYLRDYVFVMVPGGEFDFFSELLALCEGDGRTPTFDQFARNHPEEAVILEQFLREKVCPHYEADYTNYYHTFMGSYQQYAAFFNERQIPRRWLVFSDREHASMYIGDRRDKLDLLADTIEAIEADNSTADKNIVLMGHSFGGLNICDFLVELVGGHMPGTPEHRLFENAEVRQWPAEKKERIFAKIKGAVFLNTFVQGDRSSETELEKIAVQEGLAETDPVQYYIDYMIEDYTAGRELATDNWDRILQYTLRTARYRVNHYLQDRNAIPAGSTDAVQLAFDRIADSVAIVSIGSVVPRLFPALRVGENFLVHLSKHKWRTENTANDGMVDSFASIVPRDSVDYAIMMNMDHGTLVMKPHVPGISSACSYDQVPFIKTLLKRMESKMRALTH
jgi:hypothetical protein